MGSPLRGAWHPRPGLGPPHALHRPDADGRAGEGTGRGFRSRGSRRRRVAAMVGRPPAGLVRRAVRVGASWPASSGGRGRSVRMAAMVALLPSPANGVSPSTARERIAPRAQRSAGGPAGSPLTCSGARKAVVARSTPGAVRRVARPTPARRARPSAATRTHRGAQVEVGQAGGVGRLQGVEELEAQLGHPADRERAVPGDQLVEGEGVDQLGGHVDDAVLDDHVVQPDQAGMVQRGRRPHLGRHPVPQARLPGRHQVPDPGREGGAPRPTARGRSGSVARQITPAGAAAERGVQHPAAGDEPLGGVLCHVGPKRYDQTRTPPKTACEQAVCGHDRSVTRW